MRTMPRVVLITAAFGFVVIAGNAMLAQSARGPQSQQNTRRVAQPLVQRALANGRVRVIVGLNAGAVPEGLLTAAQRGRQRARIAQAQTAVLTDLRAFNFGQVKRFSMIAGMALEADLAGLDVLAAHPDVAYLEEDKLSAPTLAQSTVIVGAPTVWALSNTGAGQAVAILDTGVERLHAFFGGRVVSEACYSTTSVPNSSTSVCPGGVPSATGTGTGGPCPFSAPSSNDCHHGTHVAGIAAGSGATFHGVARSANIIAIQVFSRFDKPSICGGANFTPCALSFSSDQILGMQRVYDLRTTFNVAAANMSLGGGPVTSQATCDANNASEKAAIDALRSVGIATVISSGNNGSANGISEPGCISTAVSVGSTTDGSNGAPAIDSISSFSNSASFLNLLAPGHFITSSIPGNNFAIFAGTSMAAPHVTGAWALIKAGVPSASVSQVLNALSTTGTGILDGRNGITKPRINVALALASLTPGTGPDGIRNPALGQPGNPDVRPPALAAAARQGMDR